MAQFVQNGKILRFAALAVVVLSPEAAQAHVKWFCGYDVAAQPRPLGIVLTPDFWGLMAIAFLIFTSGCLAGSTPLGTTMTRALDAVTRRLDHDGERLFRAICGFFFVALWTTGGLILTPELKTTSIAVPWIQLLVAVALIWRRTLPLAGLGIVTLFAIATANYGVFHLADYPIFLGVAAYLTMKGLDKTFLGYRPLDILRVATGLTLMWASVEKWAYPEWSFPLFLTHPSISLGGFEDEFAMRAAGVIEFTLAFALWCGPLVRRTAAIILAGTFISATFEFGKLDVIGHAPIVGVLVLIAADTIVASQKRTWSLAPLGYAAAMASIVGIYYVAHAVIYGTRIV